MYQDKKVTIVVAAADNGVIANQGKIPWDLPLDMQRFHELTMGGSVIMGRKTLQIIGHPLDRRQNIILSKKGAHAIDGVDLGGEQIWVTVNLRSAIGLAEHEVFVIGGQKAYKEALEFADVIELTRVHMSPAGDKSFHFDESQWDLVKEDRAASRYSFLTYHRKP